MTMLCTDFTFSVSQIFSLVEKKNLPLLLDLKHIHAIVYRRLISSQKSIAYLFLTETYNTRDTVSEYVNRLKSKNKLYDEK